MSKTPTTAGDVKSKGTTSSSTSVFESASVPFNGSSLPQVSVVKQKSDKEIYKKSSIFSKAGSTSSISLRMEMFSKSGDYSSSLKEEEIIDHSPLFHKTPCALLPLSAITAVASIEKSIMSVSEDDAAIYGQNVTLQSSGDSSPFSVFQKVGYEGSGVSGPVGFIPASTSHRKLSTTSNNLHSYVNISTTASVHASLASEVPAATVSQPLATTTVSSAMLKMAFPAVSQAGLSEAWKQQESLRKTGTKAVGLTEPTQAATAIQAGFRGMIGRRESMSKREQMKSKVSMGMSATPPIASSLVIPLSVKSSKNEAVASYVNLSVPTNTILPPLIVAAASPSTDNAALLPSVGVGLYMPAIVIIAQAPSLKEVDVVSLQPQIIKQVSYVMFN